MSKKLRVDVLEVVARQARMGTGSSSHHHQVDGAPPSAANFDTFSKVDNILDNRAAVPFGKSGLPLNRWMWSNDEALSVKFLEREHNFIQWILPTDQQSQYNEDAPVMNERSRKEAMYWSRHRLDNIVCAAVLMLSFFGWLVVFTDNVPVTVPGPGHDRACANIAKHRHNVLRMTRLVRSLRIFGLNYFSMLAALSVNQSLVDAGITGGSAYIMEKVPDVVFANEFIAREFRDSHDAAVADMYDPASGKLDVRSFEYRYFEEILQQGFPIREYARTVGTLWHQ